VFITLGNLKVEFAFCVVHVPCIYPVTVFFTPKRFGIARIFTVTRIVWYVKNSGFTTFVASMHVTELSAKPSLAL
jgi:hypothetical protein